MSSTPTDYKLARQRVKEKQKFKKGLATYIIMSIFFFLLNVFTNPGHWWFIYPVLGWGIGIASHYYKAYVAPREEDKAMEEEMRRLQARNRRIEGEKADEDVLDLEDFRPRPEAQPEAQEQPKWKDGDLV
ncbi:MAG: 2TM domain-containing protein [Bacteroidota bacterium]